VVSLPPAQLPWREFQHLCARHAPPIPVLYESCLDSDGAAVGLDPSDGYAAFLRKPAPRSELRLAIEALLAEASRARGGAERAAGSEPRSECARVKPSAPRYTRRDPRPALPLFSPPRVVAGSTGSA
jgi:hypothetical protein